MTVARKIIFILFLTSFFFAFTGNLTAKTLPPEKAVKDLLDKIKQIKKGDDLTPEQAKNNNMLSDKAINFLNIPFVGQKALGKYWKKRSAEEQNSFLELLKGLFIHVAFANSAKFFKELELNFGETKITGKKAIVPLAVIHEDEGEVSIDFILAQNSDDWLVVDVILDEISMRNNLRSQFYKIIKKESYQELARRMEEKLKEAKD